MADELQSTCWAGMQALGTLMGTMFGFVSAALLAPIDGDEDYGIPAAPGVIFGSSLGVLAAYSAGEEKHPLRQLAFLFGFSVGGATTTTGACSWLMGDILKNGGSVSIMALATVSSLSSTAVFTVYKHIMLTRRAAAEASTSTFEGDKSRSVSPLNNRDLDPLIGLKEV